MRQPPQLHSRLLPSSERGVLLVKWKSSGDFKDKLPLRDFLKTCATKYWSALRRFEGKRILRSACRAGCPSPLANWPNGLPESKIALRGALRTVFPVILKLFVVKEKLFSSGKLKLGSAVDAL